MRHCAKVFLEEHSIELVGDSEVAVSAGKAKALNRLRARCQEAKHALSTASSTVIEVDALYDGCDLEVEVFHYDRV